MSIQERSRRFVYNELVATEKDYIQHLKSVIRVSTNAFQELLKTPFTHQSMNLITPYDSAWYRLQ